MEGIRKLSTKELQKVRGGYSFTCPANSSIMVKNIEKYLKESQAKASAYVKFCYEVCGYRG